MKYNACMCNISAIEMPNFKLLYLKKFWELDLCIDVRWPPHDVFKIPRILFYDVSMREVNPKKSIVPHKKTVIHEFPKITYSKSMKRLMSGAVIEIAASRPAMTVVSKNSQILFCEMLY